MPFLKGWTNLPTPASLDFEGHINRLANAAEGGMADLSGYGAKAIATLPQGVANNTATQLFFPATEWDDGGAKGTDRVIAVKAGRHIVSAFVQASGSAPASGVIEAWIESSAGVVVAQIGPLSLRAFLALTLSATAHTSSNGVGFTVRVKHTAGTSVDIAANRSLSVARLR